MYIATVIIVIRINLHPSSSRNKIKFEFFVRSKPLHWLHCMEKNEVLRVMVYQKLPNFSLELCLLNKCNTQRNCQIRNMKIDNISISDPSRFEGITKALFAKKKRRDICQNGKKSHPVQLVNTTRQIQSKAKACRFGLDQCLSIGCLWLNKISINSDD